MTKYDVTLKSVATFSYEIEATSEDEAVGMAQTLHFTQQPELFKHLTEFNWLDCYAYSDEYKNDPDYKSGFFRLR